jgi:hypothetical protein
MAWTDIDKSLPRCWMETVNFTHRPLYPLGRTVSGPRGADRDPAKKNLPWFQYVATPVTDVLNVLFLKSWTVLLNYIWHNEEKLPVLSPQCLHTASNFHDLLSSHLQSASRGLKCKTECGRTGRRVINWYGKRNRWILRCFGFSILCYYCEWKSASYYTGVSKRGLQWYS